MQDRTELRRADGDDARQLLGVAAQAATAAVFLVDAGGRCLAANAAAAELSGYDPDELGALPPGGLNAFADEGATHRVEISLELRHGGQTHLLRADGSTACVEFVATPTTVDGERAILALCWPR